MTPGKEHRARGVGRTQILALAAATGTAAALLAYFALTHGAANAGRVPPAVPVVTAARDLPPRQVLAAAMLRVVPCPSSEVPSGAFRTKAALLGKVTAVPIPAGEPVTASEVTARDRTTGMAALIAPSRRAVGIPLDAAGGVTGFLEPGDRVDVVATFDMGAGQSVSRLIVADARLLALGTRGISGADADAPATSATLEVTPTGAQALALAAARGRLTLALRGLGDDDQSVSFRPLPSAAVTGPAPPPASPPSVPPTLAAPAPPARTVTAAAPAPVAPAVEMPPQITVVRGTQKTTVTVGE